MSIGRSIFEHRLIERMIAHVSRLVDEIGREYPLAWEVVREWVVLSVFPTTQPLCDGVILRRVSRIAGAQGVAPRASVRS